MQQGQVTIQVPATTANLGPGFDCLGMALDLWNTITMEVAEDAEITINGEGAADLPTSHDNLVYRAAVHLFHCVGEEVPHLSISCHNRIPLKRGLGSSAAAIVGGLMAANVLCEHPFTTQQLLKEAVHLEVHPDNVAAALMGGLQVVVRDEEESYTVGVSLPQDMSVVLLIPQVTVPTKKARRILPRRVSREDAVYNLSRVALLVNALSGGRVEDLRLATQDRLHQPYRERLFPAMPLLFCAALDAGALGVFLSGSGPTILALTRGREMTVGYEMADVARRAALPCDVKVTRPSALGAHTLDISKQGTQGDEVGPIIGQ